MSRTIAFLIPAALALAVGSHALSQGPLPTTPTKSASPSKAFSPSKTASATKALDASKALPERLLSIKVERALVTLIDDNKVPATELGMLTALTVKEGDSVELGAALARIDDRETLAKQRIAQGELDAALAQAANEAELEVAQKAEEVSRSELDQMTEIREKSPGAVALSEWRKYKFQLDKAIAQVKQAINEREIAKLTAGAKQAQLDATSVELDLRQIKAPFKGQVVEIYKHPGDWVQAGEAIMHVVGLDKVRVKGMVRANFATASEVLGKPVAITVNASGDKQFTVQGIINFASPVIEGVGESRHFRVHADVTNEVTIDPVTQQETWKIQPGSSATMNIDLAAAASGSVFRSFKPVTDDANSDKIDEPATEGNADAANTIPTLPSTTSVER
jgi:multidrug efflux pump subunit AcrA (membrane-fusion protein)